MPLTVTTLPVKKCSGNDRSHFQNTNINIKISAENGQSATATTAACGRNGGAVGAAACKMRVPLQGTKQMQGAATRTSEGHVKS